MKKLIITCFVIISLISVKGQTITLANTILWKISGDKLSKPSYILITGTSCDEALVISDKIKVALKQVSAIDVEFDLYGSKDADKLGSNNIAVTDSQKLKSSLNNEEYLQYSNILKNIGYPQETLKALMNYKIAMLYGVLKLSAGTCGIEHEPLAYETQLKPLAKKNKLAYGVLQNIDEVIAEINSHTNNYWKQNLQYHLKNEQVVRQLLSAETDFYKTEKITSIQKMYQSNKYYQLQYSDSTLQKHVSFLTEKIVKEMVLVPIFISIDISNIVFKERSVFEMLKAKGYNVTPVM